MRLLCYLSWPCRPTFKRFGDRLTHSPTCTPMHSQPDRATFAGLYSDKNASDCSCVISNGFRQRILAHASLSSLRTMYDCALANRARSRSSAPRGNCARFRRTTHVTWYSPAWPHLGQVRVCFRCSVVSLKNSRSSISIQPSEAPPSLQSPSARPVKLTPAEIAYKSPRSGSI